MNIQTFRSKLEKGERDFTKEVVVVVDNSEYEVTSVTKSVDKVIVLTKKKEVLPTGDSIENAKLRREEEDKSPLENVTSEQLEEVKEILAEDEVEDQNKEDE